jgi:hypothetical protein
MKLLALTAAFIAIVSISSAQAQSDSADPPTGDYASGWVRCLEIVPTRAQCHWDDWKHTRINCERRYMGSACYHRNHPPPRDARLKTLQ